MKIIQLVLASLSVLVGGCTAGGPAFSPTEVVNADKALIYIYRPFNVIGCGLAPCVYIDEVKYAPLKNKGYLVCFIEPGKRMIELREPMWSKPLTVYPDLESGKEYYIRLAFYSEVGGIKIEFGSIPKEYAIREIIYTQKVE